MKPACLALSSALLLACTACAAGRAPEPPPDEQPALGPATWTPLPPPSNAPVDTSPPPADFWKLGQAACPEGATFSPALPPYFQAACTRDGKIDGPTATFDADGHLLLLDVVPDGVTQSGFLVERWERASQQIIVVRRMPGV